MEIQLQLRGNSEGFILQSKLPDDEHWTERIEIVQEEEGYRLYAKDVEILVLKESEYISKRKRIVARGLNKDLIYSEEERFEHLWEQAYWHGVFQFNLNNYEMKCVGSGSKGDILPVTKDGIPIAVYAASNIAIAGKRNFSLYTENIDEIDNLLMFYVIVYIRGYDFLDIDSLSARYRFFYQFDDRSAITKEHLDMLPEERRPSKLEAFIIYFLSAFLVVGVSLVSLRPLFAFLVGLLIHYIYTIIKNWRNRRE